MNKKIDINKVDVFKGIYLEEWLPRKTVQVRVSLELHEMLKNEAKRRNKTISKVLDDLKWFFQRVG